MPDFLPIKPPAADATRLTGRAVAVLRYLSSGVMVCGAVAVFFSFAFDNRFGPMLVFSLCIGLSCQALIDGGRRLVARWLRKRRPDDAALRGGWPGWHWTLPIILGGTWGGVQIGHPLASWILGMTVRSPGLDRPRGLFIILAVSVVAAVTTIYWSWSRERMAASEAKAQAAQRAAAENQLKLLESQLEPHMLFNTLANLRVLIGLDAARAQAMLDRLIAFLRATLQASRTGSHALADEFARLDDYLALMAVRLGPRLTVSLTLPEGLRNLPVPPLLLQPLVENSIKHGLEPQVAGGRIEVTAAREGSALVLTVRDNGVGLAGSAASSGTQFGLEQVRARLSALYGPAATLMLAPAAGGGTLASITLPLPTTP